MQKQCEHFVSVVRNIFRTKMVVSEEINKIEPCLYQIVLFVARKNQDVLKINKRGDDWTI